MFQNKNLDAAIGLAFRAFVCRNNDIGVALIDANTSCSVAIPLLLLYLFCNDVIGAKLCQR